MNLQVKIRFCKSRFVLECDTRIIESPAGERLYAVVSEGKSATFGDAVFGIPLDEPSCCPICVPVSHIEYLNTEEVGSIFKAVKAAIVPRHMFGVGENVVWNTRVVTPDRLVELVAMHGEGPFSVRSVRLLGSTCYLYTLHKVPDSITGVDLIVDAPELILSKV